MRRFILATVIGLVSVSSVGCSYGAMASHGDKLYIARNDGFLFGALRKVYECTASGGGNMTCVKVEGAP